MIHSADVKQMLNAYRNLERDIDLQCERLDALEAKMYSVGAQEITDMPRSPSPSNDRMAVLVERHIRLKEKVDRMSADRDARRDYLEMVIAKMDNPELRATVQMHYLDGHKWDTVTEMMFGTEEDFEDRRDSFTRRVMNLHGEALREMAEIINGL